MLNLKNGLLVLSLSLFTSQVVLAETAKVPPVTDGMVLLLDASDLDANGEVDEGFVTGLAVNNWRDKSSYADNNTDNDNNAYANNGKPPKRLKNQLNGKGTVAFKEGGLSVSSKVGDNTPTGTVLIPTDSAYTKVVLFKINNKDDGKQNNLISSDDIALFTGQVQNSTAKKGPLKVWHRPDEFSFLSGTKVINDTDYHIAVARYAQPAGLINLIKVDGVITASNRFEKPHTGSTTYIGSISNGNFLVGEIAEAIIYNRALTDAEIVKVERYLKEKWGGLKGNKISFKVAKKEMKVGTTLTLSATSTARLPVRFASDSKVCTVTKKGAVFTVKVFSKGDCVIDADQSGNASFQVAKTVSQTIKVIPTVTTPTPTPTPTSSSESGGGSVPTTLMVLLGLLSVRRLRCCLGFTKG